MNYLTLKDLSSYNVAFDLSNYIWEIVTKWDYFANDTIGKQFVRSIDSISANIAEGFVRYYKKDKILFYRYSYGSIQEAINWIEKANVRELVNQEQYEKIKKELEELPRELNTLIKFTYEKLKV
ncbi:MAG: four helix bundle protein [Bacteroidetes bacterium]|nr:four helix bundle protein [Bacteroidota bacterium]